MLFATIPEKKAEINAAPHRSPRLENLKIGNLMDMEYILGLVEENMLVAGKRVNNMKKGL